MAHSAVSAGAETKLRKLPVQGRRALPAADPEKRKRLLHAAVQTFGRRGFHEAKIAEIAAEAGVAEGTVYLYFSSKEDLLGLRLRRDDGRGPLAGPGDPDRGWTGREKLKQLVGLHLSFLARDRDLASVFQIELRRSARLVERFSRTKLSEYFRLLDGVVREGIASGELPGATSTRARRSGSCSARPTTSCRSGSFRGAPPAAVAGSSSGHSLRGSSPVRTDRYDGGSPAAGGSS